MRDIKGGLTKLPSAIWMVQLLTYHTKFIRSELYCLKMPDSWSQIIGLPTVASLVSNIQKLEIAARDSRRFWDPTWDPLGELENVIAFLYRLGCTQSTLEKRILASPNMRFFLQLPSSLRESLLRELVTSTQCYTVNSWWMPIFVGICDSELEKLLLQDYTLSRRIERFRLRKRRFFSRYRPRIRQWWHHPTKALEPSHMNNLQEVDLFECKLLVEIRGLEELGSLSSLAVAYCRSIETMPDLSKSRKLRELRVGKCPKLRSMEGLERLESLKCLRIHDCRSLESLVDTSNLDLECCLIVRCKRLPDRRNYCKRGRGCYCEMLFEGLWKSDPMEVQQVLQGHPDVAPDYLAKFQYMIQS
ncbi:uncharacterized protein LOC104428262 isoform X2 [Eucalyptus grandis]|uniref:uncharacterized protein LOC104428262 isoform X2 n=2 Tax=Eucalyptus grandis TaxID=71139 RepID=UPI00192ECC86|nr:uncharacterized protein LOC104428262 isoform X2 [Eucalyptus grandis]XP_039162583.1 uncharacterized protein LOC104428262 isoform X2 [Eucalyptus grandis]XP_039162584.1 uncharacterized protein LOC104428262 isoform X2 [Eucalyptus grandis]XP_039162585.1 uncharacterized protein LOC104428262 isoform X2 [Eucalyptus grandis]XP_039162586.1 uncharacterized protein LOC104428262 isoform X2 [Eucalyptus grandis]XP_039162587.1 uncharacterized protein LOC104428262 isoform X2 [Eucalyptus grandis]XP_03916258